MRSLSPRPRTSVTTGDCVRDPRVQSRIAAALKHGLQTRAGELALARMLGDLPDI